ncbi:MAG: M6 family metalloprotease domain-containing protein [Bacteroidaceae bacterium]|nr:M6 family metalloprotease domain-containing protein [Bacteroidaceae bacterium]
MKRNTGILAVLLCLSTTVAVAQTEWKYTDEWTADGRPECLIGDAASGSGAPHRGMHRIGSQATAPMKARGVQHVPVVLVEFQDVIFSAADSVVRDEKGNLISRTKGTDEGVNEAYRLFCNGTMDGQLYRGHRSYGSVRDYFVQMSDSVFLPEFTVIGPVKLDKPHGYYGENTYNSEGEVTNHYKNISQFCKESIAKAMEVYTDWDLFDNDGNGTVDMVYFVFAGVGESNTHGAYPEYIWPHEWTKSYTINGKVFATYGITCECRPWAWSDGKVVDTNTDGIGVFCHELSHALGLPDFYDTVGSSFGMDIWSVMDYGNYANNGYCPVNYTAYEREFMGWQPLTELTEPCVLTIPCFADGGGGYKIVNEANPNEYYIIENRQMKGWDSGVGQHGHGLQVTHVDYNASRWSQNTVNTNPAHQYMTIIAANNRYIGTNTAGAEAEKNKTTPQAEWIETMEGNLFPGNTLNYNLTDETTPAAEVYAGGLMHKPLRNITENEDGTVTVCFRTNGQLATPQAGEAEDVKDRGFDAVWEPVEHATSYVCELYRDDQLLSCDTVQTTLLHYADLLPSTRMKYRVKAMADSPEDWLESPWSDFSSLETLADLIGGVKATESVTEIYDLSGRKVSSQLQKGIYIQNGRKRVK